MEISSIIEYERLFSLELRHPVSDEPLGITFQIRSAASDESKKVLRKHLDDIYERRQRGKLIKGSAEIRRELEKCASYIASWDWGGNTWHGSVPDFSMEKAVEILEAEGWIFEQVTEAANALGNFSQSSAKKSPKQSG